MEQTSESKQGGTSAALERTFATSDNTINPLSSEGFVPNMLISAFKKEKKQIVKEKGQPAVEVETFAADLDGDGIVTQGELRYWLDIETPYQDTVLYDEKGRRIATNDKRPIDLQGIDEMLA